MFQQTRLKPLEISIPSILVEYFIYRVAQIVIIYPLVQFELIIIAMNAQRQSQKQSEIFYTWLLTILAFGFAYLFYRVKNARKRKLKFPRNRSFVTKSKIVVAIEIKDFIVKYSNKKQAKYLPLDIGETKNWYTKLFGWALNFGHYYRPLFATQKIKQFMFGLKSIQNVELCLYSSLSPDVVNAILDKLHLTSCFPLNRRKFCDLDNDDDQKHAIQVDQDSRRVIIITPSYQDHFSEDEKYFLVLRPKIGEISYLKEVFKSLKQFLEANEDIDSLHDELSHFKIQVESDFSDYQI